MKNPMTGLSMALAMVAASPALAQDAPPTTSSTVATNGQPNNTLNFKEAVDNFVTTMNAYLDDTSSSHCKIN